MNRDERNAPLDVRISRAHLDTISPSGASLTAGEALFLRGWLRHVPSPVERVRIIVDGAAGRIAYPLLRDDVAADAHDPHAAWSGFVALVETDGLRPARYTARIEAFAGGDWLPALSHVFEIAAPARRQETRSRLKFHLDALHAESGVTVTNPAGIVRVAGAVALKLCGWCVDLNAGIVPALVRFEIGGVRVTASVGLHRPDVAAHLGHPAYEFAGFAAHIPAGALPLGTHEVVLAALLGGSAALEVQTHVSLHVT